MLENSISSSSFVGAAVMNMGRKSQGVCAPPEVWKEQDAFAHSVQVVAEDRAGLRVVYSQLSSWKKSQPWGAKIGERKIKFGWLRVLG